MPQRIQAPDGSVVEFPDGMSDDQISAVMRQEYGGGPKKTSQTLGFMQGLATPLSKIPASPANFIPGLDARRQRASAAEGTRAYFDKREQTERPGTLGKIAGNVLATLPVAAVTRNPFASGAAQGYLTSESDTAGGQAVDTVLGGAFGAAAGKVVDAAADFIKPTLAPAVKRLNDAGVKLTPGMVKGPKAMAREDKAMSRPIVGDAIAAGRQRTQETFNVATVNEALKPLGVKVPANVKAGHDAVAFAKQAVGEAYDRVVPNLAVRLNPQQFIQPIAQQAATLPRAQQAQLQKITSVTLRNGTLTGQALKDAQGELRRLAGVYGRDASAEGRELGRVLSAMDEQLTKEMLAQNPKWAPELQRANTAYRGYRIVADAASRADDGMVNTGQLKQSVRRSDGSKSKDASARGQAFMQRFSNDARTVIPSRTPDSGTAGRMQAGNIFANVRGVADAARYQADEMIQNFRLAPRPAGARKAARTVRRLKGPATTTAVAAGNQVRR